MTIAIIDSLDPVAINGNDGIRSRFQAAFEFAIFKDSAVK